MKFYNWTNQNMRYKVQKIDSSIFPPSGIPAKCDNRWLLKVDIPFKSSVFLIESDINFSLRICGCSCYAWRSFLLKYCLKDLDCVGVPYR